MKLKATYTYSYKNMFSRLRAGALLSAALMLFVGAGAMAQPLAMAGDAEDAAFFSSATDIPLMENLYELTDQSLVFDKADGRIVEATAVTNQADQADIEYFYRQTLPHLGWQKDDRNLYSKDGEILKLSFEKDQDYLIMRLSMEPQ